MLTMGQAMRKCREERGYSRQRLSNKSNVAFHSIVTWEKDRCIPNVLSIIDLADALNVSIDELVGRKFERGEESQEG